MLTVLWKKEDGYEEVFPDVTQLWKTPVANENETYLAVGFRFNEKDTGETRFLNEGTVYVMNEHGRTVATYYLAPGIPSEMPKRDFAGVAKRNSEQLESAMKKKK